MLSEAVEASVGLQFLTTIKHLNLCPVENINIVLYILCEHYFSFISKLSFHVDDGKIGMAP